jgi:hypothetical protein
MLEIARKLDQALNDKWETRCDLEIYTLAMALIKSVKENAKDV